MLTPQEVSEKVFPKASFGSGGYAMGAVDEFLDTLTEDYSNLYKENMSLKAKLKVLADKVEEYRATEDAMRSTLLTAQKMASRLVQEAQTEKDELLADARRQHSDALAELENERRAAEERLRMAQENLGDFIKRSAELCRRQSEFLTALPEMPVNAPAAAADAAVEHIGEDILSGFAAEVAEEAAPAESAPQLTVSDGGEKKSGAVEDTIPLDFKLSLDELKFGRNYSGE